MSRSIEQFIDRLQSEGVEAGREAGERIRAEGEAQARDIVHDAKRQASVLVQDAESECQNLRDRTEAELQLAARDAVRKLQHVLSQTVQSALAVALNEQLRDSGFLQDLLRDVVMQYVQADVAGADGITINLSELEKNKLVEAGLQRLHEDVRAGGKTLNVRGTLAEAGFEYRIDDGTVEVTVESILEVLGELVGPVLRDRLTAAAGGREPAANPTRP